MRKENIQTDHRECSDAAIRERMRRTRKGDEVLFNDRQEPLTVIESSDARKEWEVHFATEDGTEVVEFFTARSKSDLAFEKGDEIDAWDPPYVVREIEKHSSAASEDSNCSRLTLEGPRGGEYELWNSGGRTLFQRMSGNTQAWGFGSEVSWFQNQSQP
jgi:hypothetical protein